MAKRQTPAELHSEMVGFGMETYRERAIDLMGFLCEDGQVPGLEKVSRRDVSEFFRGTPPEAWLRMAQENPEGAIAALQQFAEAEEGAA